jgi:hypothetical protein
MTLDIVTLIWLFPIAFMLHDFEELIFFEPWLKKNASVITGLKERLPAFLKGQLDALAGRTTAPFAFSVLLIFILASLSSLLAAACGNYVFFLAFSSLFLLHGFVHVGQAVLLRRYVPSLVTSLLVVIPYGLALFRGLFAGRIVAMPGVLVYVAAAIVLGGPFVIAVQIAGEYAYGKALDLLVG